MTHDSERLVTTFPRAVAAGMAVWLMTMHGGLWARLSSQETTTPPQQAPSFVSSTAELVVLPVAITDKRGGFVAGLGRDRFTVYDNGRRQNIAFFSNDDVPVSIGLVIDGSGSMGRKMAEVIVAALAFARSSNPDD